VKQEQMSLLLRLEKTGYFLPELTETSRFANKETLKICRIVNGLPTLQMASIDENLWTQLSDKGKQINQALYNMPHDVIFVSVDGTLRKDALISTFCIETDIVVFHDILRRIDQG